MPDTRRSINCMCTSAEVTKDGIVYTLVHPANDYPEVKLTWDKDAFRVGAWYKLDADVGRYLEITHVHCAYPILVSKALSESIIGQLDARKIATKRDS